ncbi:hypothetical protein [Halopelagius longus]|nr:hypothetical protein [Halopelagius longus]
MSERISAPASETATEGRPSPPETASRGAGSDASSDGDADADDSAVRTATRLLRLLKVALGAVVSFLTALKLLGFL